VRVCWELDALLQQQLWDKETLKQKNLAAQRIYSYIYTRIHMFIYTYTYLYMYEHIYIYIHMYIYVCIHVCICIYIVCIHVCICIYIHTRIYKCACVCMQSTTLCSSRCVRKRIYNKKSRPITYIYTCVCVCVCMCACVCVRICVCVQSARLCCSSSCVRKRLCNKKFLPTTDHGGPCNASAQARWVFSQHIKRDLYINEKWPICICKETHMNIKRDLSNMFAAYPGGFLQRLGTRKATISNLCQELPTSMWKETYIYMKRDLHVYEKRPICMWKEICKIHLWYVLWGLCNTPAQARSKSSKYIKRDLCVYEKKPECTWKVKRDLAHTSAASPVQHLEKFDCENRNSQKSSLYPL